VYSTTTVKRVEFISLFAFSVKPKKLKIFLTAVVYSC